MDANEQKVLEFFKKIGVVINKIPESSEKSPDFIILDGDSRILVELKTKFDSESLVNQRKFKLDKNEMFEKTTVLKRTNTLSGIIKDASNQLSSQKKKLNADYCFIYLQATGLHSSEQFSQFEVSLYGSKHIIPMGVSDLDIKNCYYFTNSDFFNNRKILDGAFIFGENAGRLCLNTLSPNYLKIISGTFVDKFKPGVLDPGEQERNGLAYILDSDLPRSNEDLLIKYLQNKYNLSTIVPFNWPHMSVISKVNIDSD